MGCEFTWATIHELSFKLIRITQISSAYRDSVILGYRMSLIKLISSVTFVADLCLALLAYI